MNIVIPIVTVLIVFLIIYICLFSLKSTYMLRETEMLEHKNDKNIKFDFENYLTNISWTFITVSFFIVAGSIMINEFEHSHISHMETTRLDYEYRKQRDNLETEIKFKIKREIRDSLLNKLR